MPWKIEARNDEWCVVKESDGEVEGCHASRGQAVAQQRALYAKEASTASAENGRTEPVRIQIGPDKDEVAAGLVASIEIVSERLLKTEETISSVVQLLTRMVDGQAKDRESFVAALTAAASQPLPEIPAPIVNITVPEQPAPVVNVAAPQPVVKVDVPTPSVNVTIPGSKKTITFERDPLTGSVSKAEISEDLE